MYVMFGDRVKEGQLLGCLRDSTMGEPISRGLRRAAAQRIRDVLRARDGLGLRRFRAAFAHEASHLSRIAPGGSRNSSRTTLCVAQRTSRFSVARSLCPANEHLVRLL